MINFGLAFGAGIVSSAERSGTSPAHSFNAVWPLLLSGGFLANAAYCVVLMRRKSGFGAFGRGRVAVNFALAGLMGVLWMGSNVAYGYGSSRLGPLGLALGWPIMMACVMLTANGWGVATGEWRGASTRAKGWMAAGVLAIIAGVAVIAHAGRAEGGEVAAREHAAGIGGERVGLQTTGSQSCKSMRDPARYLRRARRRDGRLTSTINQRLW